MQKIRQLKGAHASRAIVQASDERPELWDSKTHSVYYIGAAVWDSWFGSLPNAEATKGRKLAASAQSSFQECCNQNRCLAEMIRCKCQGLVQQAFGVPGLFSCGDSKCLARKDSLSVSRYIQKI